jgi:hypothetical protein
MKRISLILTFCFVTLLGSSIQHDQGGPNKQSSRDTSKTQVAKDSIQVVKPQKSRTLQGVVEVSFRIDESGEVDIVNITADNSELIEYVLQKFKKIKLDPANYKTGKTIKYKFEFKKQA